MFQSTLGRTFDRVIKCFADSLFSAFWGKSFVAELNRLSEHGERKLKMRRESLLASPTSPTAATGLESTDPTAVTRGGEVDGAIEEADDLQDGLPDGIQDGLSSGVNGDTDGRS